MLATLLAGEIKAGFARNVVKSRQFSEMLKKTLNAYHNRAIQTQEVIEELIGHADRPHEDSVPIKPEQLAALLDALREAGKDELHLAVALVGLFGLRPAELGVLRVEEGRL